MLADTHKEFTLLKGNNKVSEMAIVNR